MKKKSVFVFLIAIIAVFALGLAACSPNSDPNHNHDFTGEWHSDASGHQRQCIGCDELSAKQDHTFENGQCTECGYTYEKGADGLQFTLNKTTQTYSVTKYTGTEQQVIIPSYYKDKKVTSIGDRAFYGCSSLTSVTISENVTSIREWAFYECQNLTEVHISDIENWLKIDFENGYSNPLVIEQSYT